MLLPYLRELTTSQIERGLITYVVSLLPQYIHRTTIDLRAFWPS